MLEAFLILLAGGVMLAAAVSDPKAVTLHWLRLAGIIALAVAGIATYWFVSRDLHLASSAGFRNTQVGLVIAALLFICLQLAFVQVGARAVQRVGALLASIACAGAGTMFIHVQPGAAYRALVIETLTCIGVSAMCGLALMDMLLGHAYLTAARMTIAPFVRLNRAMIFTLGLRAACAVVIALLVNRVHPVEHLVGIYGLYIGTRWFVGLLVPAVFAYMAHDCIKRRSTQSATGILYVAGVLIFIGEIIALQLVRDTGLPF